MFYNIRNCGRVTNVTGSCLSWLDAANKIMSSFTGAYSLAHVEGEADVLFFGEEQNEEVITRLTLLDGRIQTDLLRQHKKERV